MSTYGKKLNSGWSPAGITDVWASKLPGDYMQAGHTYAGTDKWAMDRGFSSLFEGPQAGNIKSFETFLNLKKNPEAIFSNIVAKGSPDFLLAKMKYGG